ncbi:MAG: chromosomal replication initiator protein DnaA [Alphaproteobacteria bacterium]|nr:chromosomal replication initiator protein DnaA [Alphaproteobacteria bacterium]
MSSLWEDVRHRIEQRVGAQNYEIWIKPIRLLALNGKNAELEVPNRYYLDWVQDNYADVLAEELSEQAGHALQLHFTVEAHADAPDDPHQAIAPPPIASDGISDRGSRNHPGRTRVGVPPDKTFDNYVVGACNQFAHAAALAVADFPGQNYNPLFVFGGTGLGKTHLVQAIGNRIASQNPKAGIVYTTAEDFVNEMIRALRFKKMEEFRARYRGYADVLVIDDIQFLSGKDRSQAEFFHTFEALKNSGRQIILTADVLPREIDKLEPRLRTRFEGGLLADIQAPDLETLIAILHRKGDSLGLEVPDDLATWISQRVRGNIRELEGALNRLAALHRFYNEPLSIEFARRHLSNLLDDEPQALTPERIMREVARFYSIKVSDIKGSRRLKAVVRPRQIAMYLSRRHTGLSFPDLGRAFGGRDHSTVQHACKQIQKLTAKDPDLRQHVETLEQNLGV